MGKLGKMGAIGLGLLACLLAGNAWADRWHGHPHGHPRTTIHWGIHLGNPWLYPYPPPFYRPYHPFYPPHVVVVPAPPPVRYIERSPPQSRLEPGYWYYCNEAQAYYPDVQQCPGPWQPVAPQPPQR